MKINPNPNTIWNKLVTKLGRNPTHEEAVAELTRIFQDAATQLCERGRKVSS